jgi:hypothetical protein
VTREQITAARERATERLRSYETELHEYKILNPERDTPANAFLGHGLIKQIIAEKEIIEYYDSLMATAGDPGAVAVIT